MIVDVDYILFGFPVRPTSPHPTIRATFEFGKPNRVLVEAPFDDDKIDAVRLMFNRWGREWSELMAAPAVAPEQRHDG